MNRISIVTGLLLRRSFMWMVIPLLLCCSCFAQDEYRPVNNIERELVKVTSDTAKMNFLLSAANYFIMKPREEKKDLDSANYFLEICERIAKTSRNGVWTARCNMKRSQMLREKGAGVSGKPFAELATEFFRTSIYKEECADALFELANYCELEKDDELARRVALYREAIAILEKLEPTVYLADKLKRLGDLYHLQENYLEAIAQLNKSLEVYESLHYTKVHEVYDLLGACYAELGSYKKAIEYGLKAVAVAFESKDTLTLGTLYNRLGISYYSARHYPEAGVYFTKALNIANQRGDSASMIIIILNNVNVYNKLNKQDAGLGLLKYLEKNFTLYRIESKRSFYTAIVINYCNRKQPELAKPYYEKLLAIERSTGHSEKTFVPLIRYNLAVKNFTEAYKSLHNFEVSCLSKGTTHLLATAYLLWFKADSASGNLSRAIRRYQQYKMVEDSLFSEENSRAINELKLEFELAQKNNELKLKESNITLLNKQQKLQEAEISSGRTTRNIVIGGSITLALLLALIFNQYRIKKRQYVMERKSHEELISKQREINDKNVLLQELVDSKELLVREIHHRVKNSLQVIMSLLNTQSDYSGSEQAYLTIQKSRQRLYAISLIHQKLRYTSTQTLVKMDTYIPELIDFLRDGYAEKEMIEFELSVGPIELDVKQAVPVALILNEAVTNSIKHAFPGGRHGTIKICFNDGPEGYLTFIIEDDGVGIPAEAELLNNDSMGVQLMQTLSEQLSGQMNFESNHGLKVTVIFRQKPAVIHENNISQAILRYA